MIGLIGLGVMGGGYVFCLMDYKIDLLCYDVMLEVCDCVCELGVSVV